MNHEKQLWVREGRNSSDNDPTGEYTTGKFGFGYRLENNYNQAYKDTSTHTNQQTQTSLSILKEK